MFFVEELIIGWFVGKGWIMLFIVEDIVFFVIGDGSFDVKEDVGFFFLWVIFIFVFGIVDFVNGGVVLDI